MMKKWIEALRSGKYKQGQDFLRTEEGFCCLGVLCDVLDSKKWAEDSSRDVATGKAWWIWNGDSIAMITPHTYEKVGIDCADSYDLAQLNDDGLSFDSIAQYIERTFLDV